MKSFTRRLIALVPLLALPMPLAAQTVRESFGRTHTLEIGQTEAVSRHAASSLNGDQQTGLFEREWRFSVFGPPFSRHGEQNNSLRIYYNIHRHYVERPGGAYDAEGSLYLLPFPDGAKRVVAIRRLVRYGAPGIPRAYVMAALTARYGPPVRVRDDWQFVWVATSPDQQNLRADCIAAEAIARVVEQRNSPPTMSVSTEQPFGQCEYVVQIGLWRSNNAADRVSAVDIEVYGNGLIKNYVDRLVSEANARQREADRQPAGRF